MMKGEEGPVAKSACTCLVSSCEEAGGACTGASVQCSTACLAHVLRFLSMEADDGLFRHVLRYV